MSKEYQFKTKTQLSPNIIIAIVAAVFGVIALATMAGTGISLKYSITARGSADVALWNLVWGGGDYGMAVSGALVTAFFLIILAVLLNFGIGGFRYLGIFSALLYLTCGVLIFCAIPLCETSINVIGSGTAVLGWGSYVSGISCILAAGLSVFASRGD